jgi:hypothetical protein
MQVNSVIWAERFYSLQGWTQVGNYSNGDFKFEISYSDCVMSTHRKMSNSTKATKP